MKRRVYRVSAMKAGGWVLTFASGGSMIFATKRNAIEDGRRIAREAWEVHGTPCQLVVHNRDGRIAFEHTYGRDPERFKG